MPSHPVEAFIEDFLKSNDKARVAPCGLLTLRYKIATAFPGEPLMAKKGKNKQGQDRVIIVHSDRVAA